MNDMLMQLEKTRAALTAVENCCEHCSVCAPDCPIAVSKRALKGMVEDLEEYIEKLQHTD